jgi:hypothetical protein
MTDDELSVLDSCVPDEVRCDIIRDVPVNTGVGGLNHANLVANEADVYDFLYRDLFVAVEEHSRRVYRAGCDVWEYQGLLSNDGNTYDPERDLEAKARLQRELDNIFEDRMELIERSNEFLNEHLMPWKESLLDTKNDLRDLCDHHARSSYSLSDFGMFSFTDISTSRYRRLLRRYHVCSEAYHLIQVLERRYVCSSHYLTNALDNLAQTSAVLCGLSGDRWQNLYYHRLEEFDW